MNISLIQISSICLSLFILCSCGKSKITSEKSSNLDTLEVSKAETITQPSPTVEDYKFIETESGQTLELYDKESDTTFLIEYPEESKILQVIRKDSVEGTFTETAWGDYFHISMVSDSSDYSFFVFETTPSIDSLDADSSLLGKARIKAYWEEAKVYIPEAGPGINTIPVLKDVKILSKD